MSNVVSGIVAIALAGVGVALVYQVVNHPQGTSATLNGVTGVTNAFFGNLMK